MKLLLIALAVQTTPTESAIVYGRSFAFESNPALPQLVLKYQRVRLHNSEKYLKIKTRSYLIAGIDYQPSGVTSELPNDTPEFIQSNLSLLKAQLEETMFEPDYVGNSKLQFDRSLERIPPYFRDQEVNNFMLGHFAFKLMTQSYSFWHPPQILLDSPVPSESSVFSNSYLLQYLNRVATYCKILDQAKSVLPELTDIGAKTRSFWRRVEYDFRRVSDTMPNQDWGKDILLLRRRLSKENQKLLTPLFKFLAAD